MYRSLFSAAAALSLLVSTFVSPAVTYAKKRCPDEPPSTLLSLYRKSDAIFVGKFEKATVGDVISEDEHTTVVNAFDRYSISSTLKGKTEKFFVHRYEQYKYRGEDGTEHVEDEEGYGPDRVKPGDTVLLFLKFKAEDAEAEGDKPTKSGKPELDVVHYRDAIRPVKTSEVSSYEARIKDLNGIFSSKKEASDADILKWILRCIDDPVTRWDGAFELLTSFQTLEWKKEQENERAKEGEKDAATETEADAEITVEKLEDTDEHAGPSEELEAVAEEEESDNSAYASLLSAEQKDHLTYLAINLKPQTTEVSENPEGTEQPESEGEKPILDEGDRVLFELVKRWGDARLAAAMLDRLRVAGEETYQKASWMTMIAEVLKDSELTSLGEKFSEMSWREDDEPVEAEKAETASKKPDTEEVESEQPVIESDPVSDDASEEVHDGPPAKKTYKMLRDELLAQFIDRAQVVITKETEVAKNKKAGN